METVNLAIDGMSCGGCVRNVTAALGAVPGANVKDVRVGAATITVDPARASPQRLIEALARVGFDAKQVSEPSARGRS